MIVDIYIYRYIGGFILIWNWSFGQTVANYLYLRRHMEAEAVEILLRTPVTVAAGEIRAAVYRPMLFVL